MYGSERTARLKGTPSGSSCSNCVTGGRSPGMRQTDVEKARARERNLRWMEALWESTITSAKEEDLPRSTTHDASPAVSGRYAVLERGDTTRSQWNAWTEGSPGGGHLLQSYEWGEIKRALKWRPVRLVLQREDEVVGVGQFVT